MSKTACKLSGFANDENFFYTSGQRQVENNCTTPFVWKISPDEQLAFNYSSWVLGEPSCSSGIECCIHIWAKQNFSWNDITCNTAMCPLCEYTPKWHLNILKIRILFPQGRRATWQREWQRDKMGSVCQGVCQRDKVCDKASRGITTWRGVTTIIINDPRQGKRGECNKPQKVKSNNNLKR